MIKISKTYMIVTEESAEYGEAEERGFVFQDREYSFRELVEELECFPYPSDGYGTPGYVPRWATGYEDLCFRTGETRIESIHPGNDERSQRYWAKAWQYVYGNK